MDDDLLVGRKEILDFLRLSNWEAVIGRVREGLPVEKVCGRIEMSKRKYCAWRDGIRVGKGIVDEEGRRAGQGA